MPRIKKPMWCCQWRWRRRICCLSSHVVVVEVLRSNWYEIWRGCYVLCVFLCQGPIFMGMKREGRWWRAQGVAVLFLLFFNCVVVEPVKSGKMMHLTKFARSWGIEKLVKLWVHDARVVWGGNWGDKWKKRCDDDKEMEHWWWKRRSYCSIWSLHIHMLYKTGFYDASGDEWGDMAAAIWVFGLKCSNCKIAMAKWCCLNNMNGWVCCFAKPTRLVSWEVGLVRRGGSCCRCRRRRRRRKKNNSSQNHDDDPPGLFYFNFP